MENTKSQVEQKSSAINSDTDQKNQIEESLSSNENIVYISKSRTKYHRSICKTLKFSRIAKNLSSVGNLYQPCRLCFKDVFSLKLRVKKDAPKILENSKLNETKNDIKLLIRQEESNKFEEKNKIENYIFYKSELARKQDKERENKLISEPKLKPKVILENKKILKLIDLPRSI
jgi:hypothetical protein